MAKYRQAFQCIKTNIASTTFSPVRLMEIYMRREKKKEEKIELVNSTDIVSFSSKCKIRIGRMLLYLLGVIFSFNGEIYCPFLCLI